MGRNLLLLSYFFPPGNIIGAVRPYQIARHFQQQGWNVSVICCQDDSVRDDYAVDMSRMIVRRIVSPKLLGWLNAVPASGNGWLARMAGLLIRGVRLFVRSSFFPEPFVLVKRACLAEAEQLASETRFDLLISSSLPFTVHSVAQEIAKRHSIPWVADNRDLWASSPYRRMIFPRRSFDKRYEQSVLANAQLVLGVSQGMIDYYCSEYRFNNALLVMNGYGAVAIDESTTTGASLPGRLDIVYGGGLYGGLRDPSPLLKAVSDCSDLSAKVRLHFFGSEPGIVLALASRFSRCAIEQHGRVTKAEIAGKYREASVLLVILGGTDFENGVMTGKFFEYLSFGKPVLAIASEQSELAKVVNTCGVGLATNDPKRIAAFLRRLLDGDLPLIVTPPKELSIDFQLSRLMGAVDAILKNPAQ